jgi:hypothetical protein
METIIINLKNGNVRTITDIFRTIISGNHLIITTKKTEKVGEEYFLLSTNEILDLKDIDNYTTKNNTEKYGNE